MNSIWAVIFAGLLSVVYGVVTSSKLLAADAGSPKMQEIAVHIICNCTMIVNFIHGMPLGTKRLSVLEDS